MGTTNQRGGTAHTILSLIFTIQPGALLDGTKVRHSYDQSKPKVDHATLKYGSLSLNCGQNAPIINPVITKTNPNPANYSYPLKALLGGAGDRESQIVPPSSKNQQVCFQQRMLGERICMITSAGKRD